jgi:DNA-directed RNA polymerase subunit RPC12/RpoP
MAYYTGLLLGLFFGPLGVFAAFAIDKRPQCPNCLSRLGGLARECPYCHARLIWAKEVRWY